MQINDQVEVKCSEFDAITNQSVEVWKIGTVVSFDDANFSVEFAEEPGNSYESFPMSLFEQREARLIPIQTFSSMFYQ